MVILCGIRIKRVRARSHIWLTPRERLEHRRNLRELQELERRRNLRELQERRRNICGGYMGRDRVSVPTSTIYPEQSTSCAPIPTTSCEEMFYSCEYLNKV
jgi:hypothetical protein